jgi:hypothetical protein
MVKEAMRTEAVKFFSCYYLYNAYLIYSSLYILSV